jgi:N-acetylglutamate synthase-like GNAT family acetyltransferase
MEGYKISSNLDDMDMAVIHDYITRSYWAKGIPKTVLNKAMQNSLCFGVFTTPGEQIGFARMISDSATFAYLADVFILDAHRGRGLGKWLLGTILAHPDLQGLRRITLATLDAHGLYEQFGFKSLSSPNRLMEILDPDVYQNV